MILFDFYLCTRNVYIWQSVIDRSFQRFSNLFRIYGKGKGSVGSKENFVTIFPLTFSLSAETFASQTPRRTHRRLHLSPTDIKFAKLGQSNSDAFVYFRHSL